MRRNLRIVLGCIFIASFVCGCDKPKKSAPAQTGGPQAQAATDPAITVKPTTTAAAPDPATLRPAGPFVWVLPAGWMEKPNTQPMRFATLAAADGTDVSISVFPGTAGGNLANVNRWRSQIGLQPLVTVDESLVKAQVDAHTVFIADITGPKGRILGAIVPDKSRTWFFKMQGPAEAIGKQKDGFMALVRSLTWRE